MNKLSPSEAESVFFPSMVFENITSAENWMETLVSWENNIVRNLEENFEPVGVTNQTEHPNRFWLMEKAMLMLS